MVYESGKEWVAFDQTEVQFETKPTAKAKRGESVRRKSATNAATTANVATSDQSTASWMQKPINSDSSWMPVAPPRRGSDSKVSATAASTTRLPLVLARRASSETSATNPVSSDSSEASEQKRSRRSNNNNSGNSLVLTPQTDIIAQDRSSRTQRSRSRSTRRSQAAPTPPAIGSSPQEANRGRSSSRVRASLRKPSPARRRSSSRQQRQPSPAPISGRGRSSSQTRINTPNTSANGAPRTQSTSRSQRPRSSSRTPTVSAQRRSRSSSRTPSIQQRTRSCSRSRPESSKPYARQVSSSASIRSQSRGGPPPSTTRTRREFNRTNASSSSIGPGLPPRHSCQSPTIRAGDDQSVHTVDPNLGRDITFGSTATQPLSSTAGPNGNSMTKRSNLMEKLFGGQVMNEPKKTRSNIPYMPHGQNIHPRILLTATVYHNTATNLWITTINTNQKGVAKNPNTASKYLKAFSFASEREARESAIANAPPKMLPFTENPNCFLCKGQFAVFRRAGHCRNCGVCVCNSCATSWPSRMIPDTYNLKKESNVKICMSCDALSMSFKKALMTGNYEDAIALYGTGNINLRTPFPVLSKKDEIMYPIHCAVEGGNPNVVRWLMDDHFCPIKLIRTGSGKRARRGMAGDVPILTSKGRSVTTIAMSSLKIDILRYLVIERDVSVYEAKDLKISLRALEAALQALPAPHQTRRDEGLVSARWDSGSFSGEDAASVGSSFDEADESAIISVANKSKASKRSAAASTKNGEACIICYDHSINCVMTPCGHQVCCLQCSTNLSACPVCNNRGDFIKIFRP